MEAAGTGAGAPEPEPGRRPVDLLGDPRQGWRVRVDELTGGLGFIPPVPPRLIRWLPIASAVAVVVVVAAAAYAVGSRVPADVVDRAGGSGGVPAAWVDQGGIASPVGTDVSPPAREGDPTRGTEPSTTEVGIWVATAGAVERPGLYHLRIDARLSELLAAAGGPTSEADHDRINPAAILHDGERVYVPRHGEDHAPTVIAGAGGGGSGGEPSGQGSGGSTDDAGAPSQSRPLDLNRASAAELEALPGVGPATAAAIVDYRSAHGPFLSIDDLALVRGIGPAKLDQIRPLVRV